MARVLILNGTSSSGKSTLARALQSALPGAWLQFGVDDFIRALPAELPGGITFGDGGEVVVGDAFRRLERAWMAGLAATARAGANLSTSNLTFRLFGKEPKTLHSRFNVLLSLLAPLG